jgi:hypothetical protein
MVEITVFKLGLELFLISDSSLSEFSFSTSSSSLSDVGAYFGLY